MDESTRTFLWVLAGGAFFGVLGGAFGALVGVVTWTSGRAAGTAVGQAVARAFARAAETEELSPGTRGALIGATDGFLFLGLVGTAVGAVAASSGSGGWEVLSPVALAAVLLVAGAVFFGALACGIIRGGVWGVVGLFAGGVGGAVLGAFLGGLDGLLLGSIAGLVAGTGLAVLAR